MSGHSGGNRPPPWFFPAPIAVQARDRIRYKSGGISRPIECRFVIDTAGRPQMK
jgi:hypothetical protein